MKCQNCNRNASNNFWKFMWVCSGCLSNLKRREEEIAEERRLVNDREN